MNFAIASPAVPPASIVPTAATTAAALQHKKLTEAAQQFEGMLMQELLKPMKQHGFSQDEPDSQDEGSGFGDTLSSYGTETMATAISKGGGLGIAKRVVEQVEGEKAAHHPPGAGSAVLQKE
jgi:Rod binding domain-containing protein